MLDLRFHFLCVFFVVVVVWSLYHTHNIIYTYHQVLVIFQPMCSLTSLSLLKDAFTTMRDLCPSNPKGFPNQDLKQNRSQVSKTVTQWLRDVWSKSCWLSCNISWQLLEVTWLFLGWASFLCEQHHLPYRVEKDMKIRCITYRNGLKLGNVSE